MLEACRSGAIGIERWRRDAMYRRRSDERGARYRIL